MNLLAVEPPAAVVPVKPALVTQRGTGVARQMVDEPEACVVTGRGVFGARIAEPDDQFDHVQSWRRRTSTAPEKGQKKPAGAEQRRVTSSALAGGPQSGLKRTGFNQTYAAGLSPSLGAAAPPEAASSDTTAAGMVAEAITGFSASR